MYLLTCFHLSSCTHLCSPVCLQVEVSELVDPQGEPTVWDQTLVESAVEGCLRNEGFYYSTGLWSLRYVERVQKQSWIELNTDDTYQVC